MVFYDFTYNLLCPSDFAETVNQSGFSHICEYVLVEDGDQVRIAMSGSLSESEESQLENLLLNYTCPIRIIETPQISGEKNLITGNFESFAEMCFYISEANVSNNDWIQLGGATDSDSGIVMPENGIITRVTGHVESQKGNAKKSVDLYINNDRIDDFITFGDPSTSQSPYDYEGDNSSDPWDDNGDGQYRNQRRVRNNLNIPFNAGDLIRLRGAMSNSNRLEDTCITIWYKWRI